MGWLNISVPCLRWRQMTVSDGTPGWPFLERWPQAVLLTFLMNKPPKILWWKKMKQHWSLLKVPWMSWGLFLWQRSFSPVCLTFILSFFPPGQQKIKLEKQEFKEEDEILPTCHLFTLSFFYSCCSFNIKCKAVAFNLCFSGRTAIH